jgi:hypothetical protein
MIHSFPMSLIRRQESYFCARIFDILDCEKDTMYNEMILPVRNQCFARARLRDCFDADILDTHLTEQDIARGRNKGDHAIIWPTAVRQTWRDEK